VQGVGGVRYKSSSVSRRLPPVVTAVSNQSIHSVPSVRQNSSPSNVTSLPALSLAADSDQLNSAVARLLISPLIHQAATAGGEVRALTPTATITPVHQRRRRPVDRSASEPLSSTSSPLAERHPGTTTLCCRYKTEQCRPYAEHGACKYGDKCQFAHGLAELRPVARHPKYKTDLCKTYHTTGLCPYGPRCHFIHNDDERHLNELNRFVIQQQRAAAMLVQKQRQMQAQTTAALALQACGRRQSQVTSRAVVGQGGSSAVYRSPSPSNLGDRRLEPQVEGGTGADETVWTALQAEVRRRRVRQAVRPHISDTDLDAVVAGLLVLAADSNSSITHHYQRQYLDQTQFQRQTVHHQHRTVAQPSTLNCM